MYTSILFMLVSNTLYSESYYNIKKLNEYILELRKKYTVDLALIVSDSKYFNFYDGLIDIKFKYENNKKQLSKLCDFITEISPQYDWYIKTRPEVEFKANLEFDSFCKESINSRVRVYSGPLIIKNGSTVCGKGFLNKEQFKNEVVYNKTLKTIIMDDTVYIFHKNVIVCGGFNKIYQNNQKEHEWFHTDIWNSRNIKLNIVSIDCLFTYFEDIKIKYLLNYNKVNYYYSGDVNID